MAIMQRILGRVRGVQSGNYVESVEKEQFHLNSRGDQIIVQALPPSAECTRLGESYFALSANVNALTSTPTTTAQCGLWNGEPDGGKSYVIEEAGMFVSAALAAATIITLFAQVSAGKITRPTANPNTILSSRGRRNYRGLGNCNQSVTVTAESWHPLGTIVSANSAANIQTTIGFPCYGRYVVPPGGLFGLTSCCNAITVTCYQWVRWHEVMLYQG